ncbi:putative integrase [Stygiolobus caldivivus]|uniref:Uncharacterized protein n=1 Tax=Stygiolobus caldivivus TaxID=2824673 RepID=A0A8D5U5C9_9CREN|nr:putative integrase [Stygiolobus caldivivus]BCU69776.1 hypothetical protein KN1_10730 [Stygiolobus caldivivus]
MTREVIHTGNTSTRGDKGEYFVYYTDRPKPKLRYLYVGPSEETIGAYIKISGRLWAKPPVRGWGLHRPSPASLRSGSGTAPGPHTGRAFYKALQVAFTAVDFPVDFTVDRDGPRLRSYERWGHEKGTGRRV